MKDYSDLAQRHDEVRKVLRVFAACTDGPCDQGRKICPSPQACMDRYADNGHWSGSILHWFICLVLAGMLMVLFADPIINFIRSLL